MTSATTILTLIPVLTSTGRGSDVSERVRTLFSSFNFSTPGF
jgi:Cu/Ag efflux pump CusA